MKNYDDITLDDIFSGKKKSNKRNKHENRSNNNKGDLLHNIGNPNYNRVYDRDDVLNALVNKNGLIEMIAYLKDNKKNNNKNPNSYVFRAIRDIVFASALPEAIDKVFFNKNNNYEEELFTYDVSKKDLDYLMDEILYFCNGRNDKLIEKYGYDAVESMVKAYTNILYKLNKKKIKKFKDIDNIPEVMVKRLVVLTAGKNIQNSIYQLLKYLYEVANEKSFNFTKKNTIKIFKACYGKKSMPDVAKCLMLEKVPKYEMSKPVSELWVTLDEIMRDTLEDLDKSEIEKILKEYISTRRYQERNGKIPRRLGDRRTIHPDDYKKLTKVFESMEEKDFSIISLFRN